MKNEIRSGFDQGGGGRRTVVPMGQKNGGDAPGGRMNKTKFNIQDQFLNQMRKDMTKVELKMVNGDVIKGLIKGFDSFCVVIEGDKQALVYKHAVASISPLEAGREIKLGVHE